METLLQDIRYAFRSLRKSPGLVAIAVVTLALGIGGNTTIFSVVNTMILRPLPYPNAGRLVNVREDLPSQGVRGNEVSYRNVEDWRASSRSLVGLAAYGGRTYNFGATDGEPERIQGQGVNWNIFNLLGVAPAIGRTFRPEEDVFGGERVAILSDDLWRRRFRADPGIVGRTIVLNDAPHTVIGVMPSRMEFPGNSKLWTPLAINPEEGRGNHYLEAIGLLAPGATAAAAEAELDAVALRLEREYPETNKGWTVSVVPPLEHEVGDYHAVIWIMMGAVGFVLLIACANVANLLLAKASSRQREIAVRVALGASRGRIMRQLLTESVILALMGGALGVLVATWGIDAMSKGIPADRPFWMTYDIDASVLAFTMLLAMLTGVIFGLVPALQASRTDLQDSLKDGSRGAGSGVRRQKLRASLVVGEVALSLVLLIGATLMVQSFLRVQTVSPGFNHHGVLSARVTLAGSAYDSLPTRYTFFRSVLERAATIPGATSVAAINNPPLGGSNNSSSFEVEGQSFPVGELPDASWRGVAGDFLRVLGIPLLRGRTFTPAEIWDTSAHVTIVNQTMAERFWPNQDALGRRIRFAGDTANPWMTVIGVVGDIKMRRLNAPAQNQYYVPYPEAAWRSMSILVRSDGDPARLTPQLREAVRSVSPTIPLWDIRTLEEMYRQSFWDRRLYGWMFGVFALIALILAGVGLYGVMSYMVTQRTHEIGVRMALGARPRDVQRLVVGRGLLLAGIGLLIGLVAALGTSQLLRSLLFGVSPTQPGSYLGIALFLALVAALASWLPARRATRVDPLVALRSE